MVLNLSIDIINYIYFYKYEYYTIFFVLYDSIISLLNFVNVNNKLNIISNDFSIY